MPSASFLLSGNDITYSQTVHVCPPEPYPALYPQYSFSLPHGPWLRFRAKKANVPHRNNLPSSGCGGGQLFKTGRLEKTVGNADISLNVIKTRDPRLAVLLTKKIRHWALSTSTEHAMIFDMSSTKIQIINSKRSDPTILEKEKSF